VITLTELDWSLHYYRNVLSSRPHSDPSAAASSPRASRRPRAPRTLLSALLFCSLFPVPCSLVSGCNRSSHPAQVGEKAPAIVIHDGAQTVALRDYRGKVVLLNFWASWCPPCAEEFPSLVQLQRQMPQVSVLAVAFDTDEPSYRQYLVDNNLSGLLTIDDVTNASNQAFDTSRPPETYVIDRNGVIRRKFIGMPEGGWTNPEILNYLSNL
jgi:cytochrome c biogenesis protein CcmG, thiol:disulfide interchange protein DsbE